MSDSRYEWCFELTEQIAVWLNQLHVGGHPGRVRFSLLGSLVVPTDRHGLFTSTLALKTAYQTGIWQTYNTVFQQEWIQYIKRFQDEKTGLFLDEQFLNGVERYPIPLLGRFGMSVRRKSINARRSETRQAIAALQGVGARPGHPIHGLPTNKADVIRYLDSLPWDRDPWGAGSHTGGLVFLMSFNGREFNDSTANNLIEDVIVFLNTLQRTQTGSWYRDDPPLNQKINAAMKILTIFQLLKHPIRWPESLINLSLSADQSHRDACHRLDVLYVLHQCSRYSDHRHDEIVSFARNLLDDVRGHIRNDGGLSFHADRTNPQYNGYLVSKGLQEGDIHGTHLLVWAITLCSQILGFADLLGWSPPVT